MIYLSVYAVTFMIYIYHYCSVLFSKDLSRQKKIKIPCLPCYLILLVTPISSRPNGYDSGRLTFSLVVLWCIVVGNIFCAPSRII